MWLAVGLVLLSEQAWCVLCVPLAQMFTALLGVEALSPGGSHLGGTARPRSAPCCPGRHSQGLNRPFPQACPITVLICLYNGGFSWGGTLKPECEVLWCPPHQAVE